MLCLALTPAGAAAESLCTDTWTGPGEGSWRTAANWSGGHVPTSTDAACIGAGKTVNVTEGGNETGVVQGAGTLVISGGSLSVTNALEPSGIHALTLEGGTLTGPGTVDVSSSLVWGSGTMSGSGSTVVQSAASGNMGAFTNRNLVARKFVNEGTTSLGQGRLLMTQGAELQNAGTFVADSQNESPQIAVSPVEGATPKILNTGLFEKTGGPGMTTVGVPFENHGKAKTIEGSLAFVDGGSSNSAAEWAAASGYPISLSGAASFVFTGGKSTGVILDEGVIAIEGATTFEDLTIENGTLNGAGTAEVSSLLTWNSGTMSGSGSTVVKSGATANMSPFTNRSLVARKFVNNGTTALGQGRLLMTQGAELQNAGTFVADSQNESPQIAVSPVEGATPKILNTGLFEKTGGPGTTTVGVPFENHGKTKTTEGSLIFTGGGSSNSAAEWAAASGYAIEFAGTSYSMVESELTGLVEIQSGVTLKSVKTHNLAVNLSGTLTVEGTATFEDLTLETGTLTGPGTVKISSSMVWASGTVSGSGTTVVQPGAFANMAAFTDRSLVARRFVNEGTMALGQGRLLMSQGAELLNSGTFIADSQNESPQIKVSPVEGAAPKIVNTGLFEKTGGPGTTTVSVPFENLGTTRAVEGTLEITNPIVAPREIQYGGPENPSTPGQPHPTCGGKPVSCATGNESATQTDLSIGGRGVGLTLARTYNSQAAAAGTHGAFGYGWSSSFSDHLVLEPGAKLATLVQANGSTVPFTEGSGGAFTAPAWTQDSLSGTSGSGYTLVLPDQTQYRFAGSSGRLESVTDRNGNATTLSYGESGRLESITDPASRKITLSYNGEGLIESAKDPMGHVVKYGYEGGTLASVTEPGETEPRWRFKYDASHELTELIDGRGGKTTEEYNGAHQVVSQTDPLKRVMSFEYSAFETKITNHATGSVTDERFTSNYEPVSITRGFGTSSATTESSTYDSANNVTSTTDGNGHTTKYGYDAASNRTSMVDPNKNETKWSYDATHDVETMTTPKGETTTIERDAHGNAIKISRPAPGSKTQVTKYKYAVHGELEAVTDPLEHTTKYEYDAKGDRIAEIDPEADKRTWTYNEDSQEITTVSPRGHVAGAKEVKFTTTTERDAQGRPIKITDQLKHETKYSYDANGDLESVTDPELNKTTYTYDADNEQIKVEEPNKTITETSYDGAGKVKTQTDGNKHTTTYVRNPVEEVTEVVDPLGRKTTKEYDAAGNLTSVTDAAKRTTSFKYDPANRLIEISYSDGKTPTVEYEYDADGDRTKTVDGTGTSKYTYDQLDRLIESKDGHGDVNAYEYDLANEQTKITYPNGKAVVRAFDAAGRLKSVTDWLEHTTKFSYDADSNLTATVFPSATTDDDGYAYDETDLMSEVKMSKGAETLASLVYTRNKDGGVTKATTKGLPGEEKPAFSYDENSRLTKGAGIKYAYDGADNATTIDTNTNAYDSADQLESSMTSKKALVASYSFDEIGERTKTKPGSGPATTYGYDQAGNLTSVKRPHEGEVAAIEDGYGYSGDGLRMSQTLSGSTTFIAWDVSGKLPLILNDGTNSFIYGPGGLPLEQISNSGGTALYLHHDQQGSTRMLTSASGASEATFTYGPYGTLTGSTGTATSALGYDGQYTSADTGLIYLRARVYDPATAQFLTSDPLVGTTRAPYTYAGDDPLNASDPGGLNFLEELGEGVAGWGDTLTLGATKWVREELGIDNVNTCSTGYQAGGYAGLVTGVVVPGGGEGEIAVEGGEIAAEGGEAAASTGRTVASNLTEQLAMEEAMSNPAAGTVLTDVTMSDPRWPASEGWVKMTQNVNGVEIHYVRNQITGAVDDFKYIGGTP
jgi:RHS repeat-associated protein